MRILAAAALAFSLAGCVTAMSEEDCANANWTVIGEADGRGGASPARFNERADRCASFGIGVDAPAYDAGWRRGLQSYCTPQGGYEAGRSGAEYYGVCSVEAEAGFLPEYQIGRTLRSLEAAYQSAVSALDSAKSSLDWNRDRLREARNKLRRNDLSDEERSKLEKKADSYRRSMDRLQDDMPRLRNAVDFAWGRLEDYRQHLSRRY